MNKELLQQALDAPECERIKDFYNVGPIQRAAVESFVEALAQQEQCGCREGECETKKDKACRMTIEIAERDGIPEWTPAIGIECAISNLRDDAARLRDGGYTPLQMADDLDVIANDLAKCKPDTQQEPHPPSRLCMCDYSAPSFDDNAVHPDAKAQQEQPASVDAYVGAREDAAIWKKRALEAEELNRKFIAELNGPTYLGEPAQQEQPAQEPVAALPLGFDCLDNGQLVATYALPVKDRTHPNLYTHPAPTRPALSDEQIVEIAKPFISSMGDHWCKEDGIRDNGTIEEFARAVIEAHCRGGAK